VISGTRDKSPGEPPFSTPSVHDQTLRPPALSFRQRAHQPSTVAPALKARKRWKKSATSPHRLAAGGWIRPANTAGGRRESLLIGASPPSRAESCPTTRNQHAHEAPYIEDVNRVGDFDVAISGVRHDFRHRLPTARHPSGPRIRRISALYTVPTTTRWAFDLARVDQALRCGRHLHDFPQQRKSFRHQISPRVWPRVQQWRLSTSLRPAITAIGFPTVRGDCRHLGETKKVGIIHFDRQCPITQEMRPRRSRMHTWPLVPCHTMCQPRRPKPGATGHRRLAKVPRRRGEGLRERQPTVLTSPCSATCGLEAAAKFARRSAPPTARRVYISFDIDCIDAGFVACTGLGPARRPAAARGLKLLGADRLRMCRSCGLEVVEVCPLRHQAT